MLTGIADRVDSWLHDGKRYLRVVDYKTGRKKFDLSDVLYGMNLQMASVPFLAGRERKASVRRGDRPGRSAVRSGARRSDKRGRGYKRRRA